MNNDLTFTNKKKTILSLALTLTVIAGLLVIATFFDLQISKILTKGSLEVGEYISHSGFALFFEAVGSSALYIMLSVAGVISFWYGIRLNKHIAVRLVYSIIGAILVIVGFYMTFADIFDYVGAYVGQRLTSQMGIEDMLVENVQELLGSFYINVICLVMAIASGLALISLWKRVSKEDNEKYIWWSYAIVATVVFYLIIHFIKSPIGRARYRAMNYLTPDNPQAFDEFYTRWYVINGKRKLYDIAGATETNIKYNFVSDACKSFPSGHTFSAGMLYTLLALPYLNKKFAKKSSRAILWAVTIAYTGIVAISRIVAGAHYMSDVLVGGSIAFGGAMIAREIFVCRGLHFKQLFGKKELATVEETETAVEAEETAETTENE